MNKTKLIFFDFPEMYKIFKELNEFLNFEIDKADNKEDLKNKTKTVESYLILSKNPTLNLKNQINQITFPKKFGEILEKINIAILKNNFSIKSKITIGKYMIDLNARKIFHQDNFLKLTEKEVKILDYLSKANKPTSIEELQSEIWGYSKELETHTVETHIHRLRKKISEVFKDEEFIVSDKNGYKIN